jgi:TonB family protein
MSDVLAASPWVRAIGVALVEFVWQGAVLAAIAAAALHLLRRRSAAARYAAACGVFAIMAAWPIVTVWQSYAAAAAPLATGKPVSVVAVDRGSVDVGAAAGATLTEMLVQGGWMPIIVLVWMTGAVLLTLHLAGGWFLVARLRRTGVPLPADRQDDVQALSGRVGVARVVRLIESARIAVPTVVGWTRPLILVPASTLAGLTPTELEAILVHELAHVRRHDYLVNIAQGVVETLFFYHPAVWWLSKRIRVERELCCDDLVVQLCGDRLTYARALASLEEHRIQSPAFGLAADGGDLLARVRRLLGAPAERPQSSAAAAVAILLALPFFLLGETTGSAAGRAVRSVAPMQAVPADSSGSRRMLLVGDSASQRTVPVEITQGLAAVEGRLAAMGQQPDAPRETRPESAPAPPASPAQVIGGVRPQATPGSADADPVELARLLELANRHVNAGRFGEAGRVLEQLQSLLERMPAAGARRVGGQSENVTAGGGPPPPPPPPAGASAAAPAPFRVGGAVAVPVKIKDVPPVYPLDARLARVQGIVILEAVISADGLVRDLKVLRGNPMLDGAAIDAVRQWEYTPPMLAGEPVDVIMTVTVNFTLN